MLSNNLKSIVQKFILVTDTAVAMADEKIKKLRESSIYNAEYINAESEKIQAALSAELDPIRDQAINEISGAFDCAKAAIENGIVESANTVEFENLKGVIEASDGDLSDFEVSTILQNVAGNYWALRYLAKITEDKADARKILAAQFDAPDPEYYMQLFNEEEGYLIGFVKNYRGENGEIDIVNRQILIDGDYFEKLHSRLMANPFYLTDDDFDVPTLRASERRTLRASGVTLDVKDSESRKIVLEAAQKGGTLKNILLRTCWLDVIRQEEKRIAEDMQIERQIKYGGHSREFAELVAKLDKYQAEHGIK